MAVYSPCTWNMTSAQLVTPTSSQLAAVNAIQAMITSSTYWTVNNTGTTTTGYKYVEARPTNTSSIYKDYRILFVERVNNSTNKNFAGTNPFNTTTNVMIYFAPDGGSSWCTFTPANIDSASPAYVGTRYLFAANTYQWISLTGPWTAFWMYECDGQMWISHRGGATAYFMVSIGATYISARSLHVDYNEAGTEVGLPGLMTKTGSVSSATGIASNFFSSSAILYFWYGASGSSTKTLATQGNAVTGADTAPSTTQSNSFYSTTSNSAIFKPIIMNNAQGAANLFSNFVARGVFWGANMQTRTTVKDAAGVNTLGYSWYPDDIAVATLNNTLMFMNTP